MKEILDTNFIKETARLEPHEQAEIFKSKYIQSLMKIDELTAKIQWFEEQVRLGLQKKYGPASEKQPAGQLRFDEMLNEAEAVAAPAEP